MRSSIGPRAERLNDGRLFAQVSDPGLLLSAWSRVRANQGAAGGDRVTVARFEQDADRQVARLSLDLRQGTYRPGPVRRVGIPKASGGQRMLTIPCVRDRVAQTAVHLTLSPHFEAEFEPVSFGYRPGLGVDDAVRLVDRLRREGFVWALDADIEGFFDAVPHDLLLDRLAQSLSEGPLTALMGLWLAHAAPGGRGLAQGSPLSPLLANLYLDRADERLDGRGLRLVRFADDFVILARARGDAEAALTLARNALDELGLKLNAEKTRIVPFDQGFKFLGHLFVRSFVLKSGPIDSDLARDEEALRALAAGDVRQAAAAEKAQAEEETRREAGLAAAFRVMHLRSPDRRLNIRNTAFTVEEASGLSPLVTWREILAVPHQALDRVDLYPGAQATPEALRHALATDTLLAHVNGRGDTLGWTSAALAPRASRHLAQAGLRLDPDRRLDLARRIVEGRLRNQRALLHRLNRIRAAAETAAAIEGIGRILRVLPSSASVAETMGYEGQAAALFWPAYGRCLDQGFAFRKRGRRPPADPANLLLNFASALLSRDVAVALARADLHPGIGALHAGDDGDDALVFDLMEEFRAPLCESVVAHAVNSRMIGLERFRNDETGLRIDRAGGDALIKAYERAAERVVRHPVSGRRGAWRAMMLEQAFALAAHVEGRGEYRPYVMDY